MQIQHLISQIKAVKPSGRMSAMIFSPYISQFLSFWCRELPVSTRGAADKSPKVHFPGPKSSTPCFFSGTFALTASSPEGTSSSLPFPGKFLLPFPSQFTCPFLLDAFPPSNNIGLSAWDLDSLSLTTEHSTLYHCCLSVWSVLPATWENP